LRHPGPVDTPKPALICCPAEARVRYGRLSTRKGFGVKMIVQPLRIGDSDSMDFSTAIEQLQVPGEAFQA